MKHLMKVAVHGFVSETFQARRFFKFFRRLLKTSQLSRTYEEITVRKRIHIYSFKFLFLGEWHHSSVHETLNFLDCEKAYTTILKSCIHLWF